MPIIKAVGGCDEQRFGAFMLLDVGELERDTLLSDDAPYLPPFEITLSATEQPAAERPDGIGGRGRERRGEVPFSARRAVRRRRSPRAPGARCRLSLCHGAFCADLRQPESEHDLSRSAPSGGRQHFDAGLQGVAAFVEATQSLNCPRIARLGARPSSSGEPCRPQHRRDRRDFRFPAGGHADQRRRGLAGVQGGRLQRPPRFLYRPLTVQVEAEKRKLFSIAFDRFEDPVLYDLYREKQQELDLQLSMLSARETAASSNSAAPSTGPSRPSLYCDGERHPGADGESRP